VFSILASIVTGYLLGSIPFGFLTARLRGIDIREHGSRNIGATNVWRVCGWKFGLLVFLLDALKGAGAVWLGGWIAIRLGGDAAWASIGSAMACIVGHSFPVWLGFKGGKGVATALGTLIAVDWPVGLAACATWAVVALLFRYSSLSSLLAVAAAPLFAWYLPLLWAPGEVMGGDLQVAMVAGLIAVLVWIKHETNIKRLLQGMEPKIGQKKPSATGG